MDKFKTELVLFQKSFSQIAKDDDEMLQLNQYLFQLLQLTTINELIGYYTVTKRYNIILAEFEEEMYKIDEIDRLKSKLIISFAKELDKRVKNSLLAH